VDEPFDLKSLRNNLIAGPPSEPRSGLPVASVAVIVNSEDRGGSVLLIRRTVRSDDPWSGQIGFPGGHKSPMDTSFLHTAMRETAEEVGIELTEEELLGSLPFVATLSRRVQVAPFVFQLKFRPTVRMNREVAESFWVPLGELCELQVERREVQAGSEKFKVSCYVLQDRVVWGLTFRILNIILGRRVEDDL